MAMVAANRESNQLTRDGMQVESRNEQGRKRIERMRVTDFSDPASPHDHFSKSHQIWGDYLELLEIESSSS
jgi:hypothetical protein